MVYMKVKSVRTLMILLVGIANDLICARDLKLNSINYELRYYR